MPVPTWKGCPGRQGWASILVGSWAAVTTLKTWSTWATGQSELPKGEGDKELM